MGWNVGACARAWCLALLAALSAGGAPPAAATCKIKVMELPVRLVDRRPVATLQLNGVEVPMLVDSGAFYSMLNPTTAAQLNLPLSELPHGMELFGHTGRIPAKRTVVPKVGLRSLQLANVEFIVGGNELGVGIMGILGRNFLAYADTEYDLGHGLVRMVVPDDGCREANMAYWAGDAPVIQVPLLQGSNRRDTAVRVQVSINGTSHEALMDTGAPTTTLALATARRAGIAAEAMTPAGRAGGAGEGRVTSWTAPVDLFELGGETVKSSRLVVDDVSRHEHGLLIGLDYFLSHRIYVSRQQQQVFITWNGNPIFPQAGDGKYTLDKRYAAASSELRTDDADALARRGAASLAAGQADRALEDLNRACELAPGVADYRYTRARIHLQQQRVPAALTDLDEALRLNPDLAEARLRRAGVLAHQKAHLGALSDLLLLDVQLPASANQRARMGDLLAILGQPESALKQFGLWLETHARDADRSSVLNSRCWLRARFNRQLDLAQDDCEAAVSLDRQDPNARDSLGWVLLRKGQLREARRAFDAALKLKPLPISLYGRGLVQLRLGEAEAAQRDLDEARRLEPGVEGRLRQLGMGALLPAARPAPESPAAPVPPG